ncbi:hypothetical protein NG798_27620 [Ancylothrix sp. C2]|uniref:hypothetical protein n=1 Tax=Ancylothrix sp. D3o TaxID=2953691 RepID=UPI0021BB9CDB|nr:hypothetical protein [Ancylothrix sp. D3o]MCT7953570.1 hypothetical protein [Ancylothrix sp. D3o]
MAGFCNWVAGVDFSSSKSYKNEFHYTGLNLVRDNGNCQKVVELSESHDENVSRHCNKFIHFELTETRTTNLSGGGISKKWY